MERRSADFIRASGQCTAQTGRTHDRTRSFVKVEITSRPRCRFETATTSPLRRRLMAIASRCSFLLAAPLGGGSAALPSRLAAACRNPREDARVLHFIPALRVQPTSFSEPLRSFFAALPPPRGAWRKVSEASGAVVRIRKNTSCDVGAVHTCVPALAGAARLIQRAYPVAPPTPLRGKVLNGGSGKEARHAGTGRAAG